MTGLETGELLALGGNKLTFVEMAKRLLPELGSSTSTTLCPNFKSGRNVPSQYKARVD